MPLPIRVRSKNQARAATTASVAATTQTLWGKSAAPAIWIGRSPEKGGSVCAPLPSVASTPPLSTIETPMVMMMSVVTSESRAGWIASLATP